MCVHMCCGRTGGQAPSPPHHQPAFLSLPLLQGCTLWRQQVYALLCKRALCAARDAWAALVQVAVPVLLVLLALWGNHVSTAFPQQPALPLDR